LTNISDSGQDCPHQSGDGRHAPLDFLEWVAYGALFVAALIAAADTSFKLAPDVMLRLPEFFHSVWWGLAPAVLVVVATIILLLREFVFPNNKRRQQAIPLPDIATHVTATTTKPDGNAITSSISIKRGLYVGDIRAGFDKLQNDYVIEISVRAYNGTGGTASLSEIKGTVRYGTLDMRDSAYETLPPIALLSHRQQIKNIPIFTEFVFALEQRMPSQTAMKLIGELDEGKTAVFDLRQFDILFSLDSNPDETERLPVFSITCNKHETIAQGRIAYAEIRSGLKLNIF
jgi:hypothetical protein